jgi:hypothetical protein
VSDRSVVTGSMTLRIAVAIIALISIPSAAAAQDARVYAGGSAALVTQTQGDKDPLGGTTWSGSVGFGMQLSPKFAIEFEPMFNPTDSWEYSYRPSPSLIANVVASRRDTFYSFQLRSRARSLEPVIGVSYVHGTISRHATTQVGRYFDDERSDNGVAVVGGLDAALKVAPHLFFVPTFRVFVIGRTAGDTSGLQLDPLGEQTRTGFLMFRYGVGARITF